MLALAELIQAAVRGLWIIYRADVSSPAK